MFMQNLEQLAIAKVSNLHDPVRSNIHRYLYKLISAGSYQTKYTRNKQTKDFAKRCPIPEVYEYKFIVFPRHFYKYNDS